MNNDSFLIEENDLISAQEICKYIEDSNLRSRAVANNLAASIAAKYFEDYEVDSVSGIHNVTQILEDVEISDIYINGNYIDVRLYFDESGLSIPVSHSRDGIQPVAYMFIKLSEELTNGTVTGFIVSNSINTDNSKEDYYQIKEEDLVSYYDIEPLLSTKEDLDLTSQMELQIYDFLDERLENKESFYQNLINSKDMRLKLISAAKAGLVFNFVSINETSISKTDDFLTEEKEEEMVLDEISSDLDTSLDLNLDSEFEDSNFLDETEDSNELELSEHIEDSDEINPIEDSGLELEEETEEIEEIGEPEDIIEDTSAAIDSEEEIKENPEETLDSIPEPQLIDTEESPEIVIDEEPIDDSFEYSTNVTSSLTSLDEIDDKVNLDSLEAILDEEETLSAENSQPEEQAKEEVVVGDSGIADTEDVSDSTPQIDELFNNQEDSIEKDHFREESKKKNSILPVLSAAIVIAGLGYFGYTKFATPNLPKQPQIPDKTAIPTEPVTKKQNDAMPVESIEDFEIKQPVNQGNAVSIPAIEQNLDASILVSNLNVNWEVPAGYISNNTSKRYFTKMGKIIQLNLKTELLLLSKPPITNKISLELEFDKGSGKFKIKQMIDSSGEPSVDEVITKTVKNSLDMNLNMNTNSFGNIQGNPVLIIRL